MKKIIILFSTVVTAAFAHCSALATENGAPPAQTLVYKQGVSALLKDIPDQYAESIKDAISKISTKTDAESIKFESLLGGFSNAKLFKFEADGQKYVLRLLDKDKKVESRKSEINAHKAAADLGIAPKIVYINSQQIPLIMVMEFIDGRILSTDDLNNKPLMKKVIESLKKFQNCNVKGLLKKTRIDGINDLYKHMLKNGIIYPSCFDDMHTKLQEDSEQFKGKILPTHGDLNPANILISKDEKIYLIDWCESRTDNPLLDIGWLVCMSGASIGQTKDILELYLSRKPTANELKEVMFFQNATNFLYAIQWLAKQEEHDQKKLDAILSDPTLIRMSKYLNKGKKQKEKVRALDSKNFTRVALGWLKEFEEIQSEIKSLK